MGWSAVVATVSTLLCGSLVFADQKEILPLPLVPAPPGRVRLEVPSQITGTDTFPMAIVAVIDSHVTLGTTYGDTDQDGKIEIFAYARNLATFLWEVRVFEYSGAGTFTVDTLLPDVFPFATGDLDGDGKMELVGQYGASLRVYESVDASSYPTELVWQTTQTNVNGNAIVGDSDGDGRLEILNSRNAFGGGAALVIFENVANDSFAQVWSAACPLNDAIGEKVVLDLDGDGRREVATCGNNGFVYIFESSGDNSWQLVWTGSTGLNNAYGVEGGKDTDGNGREELFVYGNAFQTGTWRTWVYEAAANDSFVHVATLSVPQSGSGETLNELQDLDGDGYAEYTMQAPSSGIWIFGAVGVGQWEALDLIVDENPGLLSVHGGHTSFDVNGNGRAEVVWAGFPEIWILEHRALSDARSLAWGATRLRVRPNPVRLEAQLQTAGPLPLAQELVVYDVAGRVVQSQRLAGLPTTWSARELAGGVYFVRIKDDRGATLASGRAVVRR